MNTQRLIKVLGNLYKIVEAGEKGYAVSAANVNNQGLKFLFKSYAQQRARYKSEILSELKRYGGSVRLKSSFRGLLHRGRIDIFAAMSAGNDERERVILKEVAIGEKVALRTYDLALKENLPDEIRILISKQFDEVKKVVERIVLLRGQDGKRLLARMYETNNDANDAVRQLADAGFHLELVEQISMHDEIEIYLERGSTVLETTLSGSIGGALWGSLIGALAGIGADQAAQLLPIGNVSPITWPGIALLGVLGGAFVGTVLGLVIGMGISEEDNYLYDQSKVAGKVILLALVDGSEAREAAQILTQVHVDARLRAQMTT
jgi:uncharacterized protein (TIGR02284 family)